MKYIEKFNQRICNYMLSGFTPRWMVFVLDQAVMLIAFLLVAFLREALFQDRGFGNMFTFRLITVVGTSMFYSILFGTYSGVVRYSGVWDFFRLAMSNSATLLTLYAINGVLWLAGLPLAYNFLLAAMMMALAFTFMFAVRMGVKLMFRLFAGNLREEHGERVLVLGADAESLLLTSAVKNEMHSTYDPVAIVDLEHRKSSFDLMGIPIVERRPDMLALFRAYGSHTALVHSRNLPALRDSLLNVLIEGEIRVLVSNRFEDVESHQGSNGKGNLKGIASSLREIQIEDLLGREPICLENSDPHDEIEGHTVLVTGAAGSIGSEICRQVAFFRPKRLILLDQAETPMYELQLELQLAYPNLDFVPVIADVRNSHRLRGVFEAHRPQVIYHAAAYKHVPMMEENPLEAISVNVGGTRILADLALEFATERFVMISTDKAVNPTNVMGASKRIAEIYVQSLYYTQQNPETTTRFITTRFGNVLGSNGSVVPLFKKQIAAGGPVTITHRDIVRYFMTIPEACSLVLEAGVFGGGGEIFVFDMGKQVKIYDLARKMIRLCGLVPDQDIRIVETGLRPGEKLYEELLSDKEKTLATPHEKITMALVRRYDYNEVLEQVLTMLNICQRGDATACVRAMKRLVPEFRSNNSVYEALDKPLIKV